jgi:hypothetical protein
LNVEALLMAQRSSTALWRIGRAGAGADVDADAGLALVPDDQKVVRMSEAWEACTAGAEG